MSSSSLKRPRTKVAIVGGGIAGLSCAKQLSSSSSRFEVTVFDTGRLRPGGRCASRRQGDPLKETDEQTYPFLSRYTFDHAAQVLSVPKEDMFKEFEKQVDLWKKEGILQAFSENSLFRLRSKSDISPITNPSYYAPGGIDMIPTSMKDDRFTIRQDVWVSPSNGARHLSSGQWKLSASGRSLGIFDQLIIAHNGKCADRLLSQTPAKDIHSLLRVNFSPSVPAYGGKRMTLNSIYSLTICLPKHRGAGSVLAQALPPSFCGAYIDSRQCTSLRFLTCQTNKLHQADDTHEVWTILSSGHFAKQYKAAQEFLSDETIDTVSRLLLDEVEKLLHLPASSLSSEVVDRRLQLWGAAVPLNVWKSKTDDDDDGFLFDSRYNVGVCGDWLVDPSLAGAWTSGNRLAKHMIQHADKDENQYSVVGLNGSFVRSEKANKAGIGALESQVTLPQRKAKLAQSNL